MYDKNKNIHFICTQKLGICSSSVSLHRNKYIIPLQKIVFFLHCLSDVLTYSCKIGSPHISEEACWETGSPVTDTAVGVKYVECSESNRT